MHRSKLDSALQRQQAVSTWWLCNVSYSYCVSLWSHSDRANVLSCGRSMSIARISVRQSRTGF